MISSLIIALIANGLTETLLFSIRKAQDYAKLRKQVDKLLSSNSLIKKSIEDSIIKIDNILDNEKDIDSTKILNGIQLFLSSSSTENILIQIYSDDLINDNKSFNDLKKEFEASFLSFFKEDNSEILCSISNTLFNTIYKQCKVFLEEALKKNILKAHELKSIIRHKILLGYLQTIDTNLKFLTANEKIKVEDILVFEKKYREQVQNRIRLITIPDNDKTPRVEINDIFISPNLTFLNHEKSENFENRSHNIDFNEFYNNIYRTVILGDPGGGKSTSIQKLCFDLCKNYNKKLVNRKLLTPVLITLRELAIKKKENDISIVQFIESEVTSKYEFSEDVPKGYFDYLLLNGYIIVLFDGLDELLDTNQRMEIVKSIETFCNYYTSTPVIVTSRYVGYDQVSLDQNIFSCFLLAPFDFEKISEYANKWFSIAVSDKSEAKIMAESFLEQSSTVNDLSSNPLLLSLMCNLFKTTRFIPQNRPDLYKKCSEMLFGRIWDTNRGILVQQPLPEPKALLSHLANWIFNNEKFQDGVSEKDLINESIKYLYPNKCLTLEEAENTAKKFVYFCKNRAWVFTDIGSTAKGETLYKFTHKTFLEYYTAYHIVRQNPSPQLLWDVISSKIGNANDDMVNQLSFQIINEQVEGAADYLLEEIIKKLAKINKNKYENIIFALNSLHYLYPNPKIVNDITEIALDYIIHSKHGMTFPQRESINRLNRTLISTPIYNRKIIADKIGEKIDNYLDSKEENIIINALEFIRSLQNLYSLRKISNPNEYQVFWNQKTKDIINTTIKKIIILSNKYYEAFFFLFYYDINLVNKKWYLSENIFKNYASPLFPYYRFSVITNILQNIINFYKFDDNRKEVIREKLLKFLITFEKVFRNTKNPSFSKSIIKKFLNDNIPFIFRRKYSSSEKYFNINDLNEKALAGLFYIIFIIYEDTNLNEIQKNLNIEKKSIFEIPLKIVQLRLEKNNLNNIEKILKKYVKNEEIYNFIQLWVNGKINFLFE